MEIMNKVKKLFRRKTFVQYGSFDLLAKALGSSNWNKSKMLKQYEKSLYVFACVSKIAEKISSTQFSLYQIINIKGDTKEVINHPVLDLIYKVNPFQTKAEFLKISTINLKLAGDAFWFKVRNERGVVVELWNLRPDYMEILKDPNEFIKAYKFNKPDGTSQILEPNDVVHFRHPTPLDDYFGTSPIKSASVRIDTESYASQYQRDFFLNNARPDGIIKANAGVAISEEQKEEMREEFEKAHKGVGNNSKIAVLEGDIDYQQISISQREMDYIESMRFTRDDILVAFGVPKAIVAITDDVNRANAETSMFIFLSEVIKPELTLMTETINEMLITPDFGMQYYIDFPDPTPENRELTIKEYDTGLSKGYMLINEVRAKENMEPIEGGWSLYKPLSEVPVGGLSKKKSLAVWKAHKREQTKAQKLKIFRGRGELYLKLAMKHKIKKELTKELLELMGENINMSENAKIKEKAQHSQNKELKPIISEDIREKYIEITIKQIDQRAELLKKEMNKVANRQLNNLMRMLRGLDLTKTKQGKKRKSIGKETLAEIKNFYSEENEVLTSFVLPYFEEFARTAGLEALITLEPDKGFNMSNQLRKSLERRAKEFGLGINKTTRQKVTRAIKDGLSEGEGMAAISDRINSVYEQFPTWRSDLISRTEATAANNEGFLEAYKQSDVATHKEWIATMDDRTRDEHVALDGEIVKVNENFSNGLPYPQEPNCRCVIGPAFED